MSPLGSVQLVETWLARSRRWLVEPLFTFGEQEFSLGKLLTLLLFVVAVAVGARLLRRLLIRRIFPRAKVDVGTAHAIATLTFYTVLALGIVVGVQASGIDLSALTVLFGAIGVGVGFGLQTITSNFIAGLIVLLEQPVRVGDRIEVGPLRGSVVRIRARATEVLTNDGISVIVPNSEIVTQQVINWSHGDGRVRIHVPVGVAYGSDVEKVRRVLLEAAGQVEAVLKSPPPKVWLTGFGESSINFELLGWTSELLHARGEFMSQVSFAIHEALTRHGIEIPFPQRDLHLRSPLPVPVSTSPGAEAREGPGPTAPGC